MPWFRCLINGENFRLSVDGKSNMYGFFTTRFVEARDRAEAETSVLKVLREEKDLMLCSDAGSASMARVHFGEIEEVRGPETPRPGIIFYPMMEQ